MPRLTDNQKKKIIADYVELGSYRAVARKHNVSVGTVKRALENDAETVQKVTQKKEQNRKDVLAHMDARKEDACKVIDKCLDALADDEKIKRSSLMQIATTMGIVVDKFTANEEKKKSSDERVQIIDDM